MYDFKCLRNLLHIFLKIYPIFLHLSSFSGNFSLCVLESIMFN